MVAPERCSVVVFDNKDIPGVKCRVLSTNGYQVGGVEQVRPFEGTYDGHLFIFDGSLDRSVGTTPYTVLRHYWELQVVCEDETLAETWRETLVGAIRTTVLTSQQHNDYIQARLAAHRGEPIVYTFDPDKSAIDQLNLELAGMS
jgi:hypothetical protein